MTTDREAKPADAGAVEPEAPTAEVARSNARLRVLAEVSRAFAMVATDYPVLLQTIARTTADLVGDGCLVTLLDADRKTLINVANAHRGAALEADYAAYLAGMRVSKTTTASVSAGVVRTGEPKLVRDIDPGTLVAQTDEALKPLVARLNVHSLVVVPVRARQAIIGTLSLVRSGPGRGYMPEDLTLLQDVADRAGLAIETARRYAELEHRVRQRTSDLKAVKIELDALSLSFSHPLREPLYRIDRFSKAVLEEHASQLDEQGRWYLEGVRASTLRMAQLIHDLYLLSGVTRGPLFWEPVDLTDVARKALAVMEGREPDRRLEARVAEGLVAQGDARLLRMMIENLLGNAWKFTSKQAWALLEFGKEDRQGETIYFVRDNGPGFDMEYAARLFRPFARLFSEADFDGTGIELFTVERVITRHGGRVWVEASPERGATFFFTLGEPPSWSTAPHDDPLSQGPLPL